MAFAHAALAIPSGRHLNGLQPQSALQRALPAAVNFPHSVCPPPCPRSTYPWQAALPLLVGRFAFIAGRLDIFAAYAHTATIIFLYWPCVASPVFIAYLRRLEGVPVENADAGCCGISDSYGFKKEKYDITQTVGSELFDKVRESGAQAAVSEFGTCRVQITHGPGKFSLHPVSILRQRLEAR